MSRRHEVELLRERLRKAGQTLIAEIGADWPEDADQTAERAAKVIRRLRMEVVRLEEFKNFVVRLGGF